MKFLPSFKPASLVHRKALTVLATFVLTLAAFGLGIGVVFATVTLTTNSITSDTGLTITTSGGDLTLNPAGEVDFSGKPISNADFRQLVQDLVLQDQWMVLSGLGMPLVEEVTGSGDTRDTFRNNQANSGTTAGSTALVRTHDRPGWSIGQDPNRIDWSKPTVIHWVFSVTQRTPNGISRVTWGKSRADGVGVLPRAGLGIQIEDRDLKGVAHNGTALDTVDLNTALTSGQVYRATVVSDGSGNVEWFLNGVTIGTSANGPTAVQPEENVVVQIEAENGVDNATQNIRLHSTAIYIVQ